MDYRLKRYVIRNADKFIETKIDHLPGIIFNELKWHGCYYTHIEIRNIHEKYFVVLFGNRKSVWWNMLLDHTLVLKKYSTNKLDVKVLKILDQLNYKQ